MQLFRQSTPPTNDLGRSVECLCRNVSVLTEQIELLRNQIQMLNRAVMRAELFLADTIGYPRSAEEFPDELKRWLETAREGHHR